MTSEVFKPPSRQCAWMTMECVAQICCSSELTGCSSLENKEMLKLLERLLKHLKSCARCPIHHAID